jgi:glucose dehydrogenase
MGTLSSRGWLVLLAVAALDALVYAVLAWGPGPGAGAGWRGNRLLWGTLALVTAAGALASCWGIRAAASRGTRPARPGPWRAEAAVLGTLAAGFAGLGLLPGPPPPEPAVRVVWAFEPPERGAFLSSPVVAGDRVYVAAVQDRVAAPSGAVYALDRARGAVVWKFDAGGTMRQTYSSPCLDSGRLYLGEGMHGDHVCRFYCLDAESGRERWHVEVADHIESSPCVAGGKVFFGAGDDGLYCLDAATGKECWHFQAPVHVDASPAVDGNHVYVGSGVTNTRKLTGVFCLDRATGRELWRVATDLPVWGSPAPDHGRVFVPLGNGRLLEGAAPPERPAGALLGLEAATGHQLWRYDVGDAVLARPAHDDRHV